MLYQIKMGNELTHHGILGMKWGVRRYQNKDGSLTAAGKKKRKADVSGDEAKTKGKLSAQTATKPKTKKLSEMSDTELNDKIKRMQLERNYLDLEKQLTALKPQQISRGQKVLKALGEKVLLPAAQDAGRKLADAAVKKLSKELLGDDGDSLDKLKKEVEILTLKQRKIKANDWFRERKENQGKPASTDTDSSNKKEDEDD